MKGRHLLCALLLIGATQCIAYPNAAQRVKAFAALPDWTGLWQSQWLKSASTPSGKADGGDAGFAEVLNHVRLLEHPPYNAELERRSQVAAGNPVAPSTCTDGFPYALEAATMFQVAIQPEETLFVFDRGLVRHIYTDGRPHPSSDDMWPTPVGDSIGHWEKQTLVIDTIGRTAGPVFLGRGADLSEAAHFVERVRRIGRDVLEDQLTITDPLRFVRPWQMTITYSRIANLDRMIPWDCANDRISSVDGKLIDSQP